MTGHSVIYSQISFLSGSVLEGAWQLDRFSSLPKRVLVQTVMFLVFGVASLGLLPTGAANAATNINVAGYIFPPFIVNQSNGLPLDLISALNAVQNEFTFKFNLTTPLRRYRDLKTGHADMVFFEMPEWGWRDRSISYSVTRKIIGGGEVYVARARPDRGQDWFKNIKDRKIAAFAGYHYGFAGFNTDARWLKRNFDISLSRSHEANIRLVLNGRADLAVVTKSWLASHFVRNPGLQQQLMVSNQPDQIYSLKALIRSGCGLSIEKLEVLFDKLKKSGELVRLFNKHGLGDQMAW